MLFGSTSDAAMMEAEAARQQDAAKARRERARIIESIHDGCGLMSLVEAKLKSRYDPTFYEALKLDSGIATWNRIFHDVLSKVNIEWDGGSEQRLEGPTGSDVTDDDLARFSRFIHVAQYDTLVMKPVSRWCWIHPAVCVMPVVTWSPNIGMRRFHHVMLTPEHFDLEVNPEDHTDWIALHLYTTEDGVEVKTSWSSEEYVKFRKDQQGRWKEVQDSRQPNPYRCIPAVIFYGDPSATGVWGKDYGQMLADLAVEVNCAETWLSYMQSLQIKIIAGQFKNFPAGQVYVHGRPVNLGDAESILEIDLQTDITRFREVYIKEPRRQAAVTMGLHADEFDLTGTPPSGEALKMRKWSIELMAAARRRPLAESLKKLYWLGLRVLYFQFGFAEEKGEHKGNVTPIEGFGDWGKDGTFVAPRPEAVLPPYDPSVHHWAMQPYKFCVDVAETVYPELAAEREAREAYDLKQGFTNRVRLYKEKNPDAPADDAENHKTLMENLRMEAEFQKASAPRTAPDSIFKPRVMPNAG